MTDPDLGDLLAQERHLVFTRVDEHVAWALGTTMRDAALDARLPVVVSVRLAGRRLFHVALPGSSADNDAWIDRKSAVVDRYGHSSFYVGCEFRARGEDFDVDARLDRDAFAAHGGAFPLIVAGAGPVGTVAVSGLPQADDHEFVVDQLGRFLESHDLLQHGGRAT